MRLLRWITAGLAIVRVGISIRHFMVGCSTTAIALLTRRSGSVLVSLVAAGTAVLTDFGYWIWLTSQTSYLAVEKPSFSIEDALMNIASLLVLLGVSLMFLNDRKQRI